MKAPCLICQKNAPLIEVMSETIERLLKEKALARNEALEEAAKYCHDQSIPEQHQMQSDGQWAAAVLANEIRNLKEQQ